MKDVFVVSSEEEHFNLFYANFRHLPIHFSWADDLSSALKFLEIEHPNFVFLVNDDKEMLLEWIQRYQNFNIDIPYLCFTKFSLKNNCEELWNAGAIDLIFLPINIRELEYILSTLVLSIEIEKTPDMDLVKGRLEDFNLIHLIQTFEDGKKSGVLILEDGIKKGELEFSAGEVMNAQYSNRDPLEAVTIMSAWKKGTFKAKQDTVSYKKRIALANQQIIIECLNYMSVQEKLTANLPPGNEVLFTYPELDFEELSPRDRNRSLAFKDGNNLEEIMNMFTGNMNQLLKKIETWVRKKWLVKKEDYDLVLKKMKEDQGKSAIKKMMEKMFSKSKEEKSIDKFEAKYSYLEKDDIIQSVALHSNHFKNYDRVRLFLNFLEEVE